MLIPVDHGNRNMKTVHHVFTSGLIENPHMIVADNDVIELGGMTYSLSNERLLYKRDKTVNDDYFVLTLFAMGKELGTAAQQGTDIYTDGYPHDIQLAVGLPPAHYQSLCKKFKAYLMRPEIIDFVHNGRTYSIEITDVQCFPQAFAAAMTRYNNEMGKRATVIDLGGYTADYIQIVDGKPLIEHSDSLENGVIHLYHRIMQEINCVMDTRLKEPDIDLIIRGNTHYPEQLIKIVDQQVRQYLDDFIGQLRERQIDLRVGQTVIIGGGGILLRKYIEQNPWIQHITFIDDIRANAHGYQLMYETLRRKGG